MKHQVHLALQIVPISREHPYPIIDKAIDVIKNSGVDPDNYRDAWVRWKR